MRQIVSVFMVGVCLVAASSTLPAQEPGTRWMDELNWVEFRALVPARVKTVLLTTGTLEPHGVIANGADNLAPVEIAKAIAPEVNALIAPHIPYGVTGALAPYPGATHIPEEVYAPYVRAVLEGLARNGFRHIVIVNGHGGPQGPLLEKIAREFSIERGVNTLVVHWWSACAEVTEEVFGNPGGHAGENETAFIQAINPALVKRELYEQMTVTPNPYGWSATPFPSSITTYQPGVGAPTDFDQAKAERYFQGVNACVAKLVKETVTKWEKAGFE